MRPQLLAVAALMVASCGAEHHTATDDSSAKMWEEFSGDNALRHVQQLVEYGPRPPGTPALEKSRVYIAQQLESAGWRVTRQAFEDSTPRGTVSFVNLIGTFPAGEPKPSPSFLLCSHYDTKIFDSARFVGANDGGSSNGVLLEIARVLAQRRAIAARVQLVFFDGEEAYVSFTKTDGLYGSRYFAKQLAVSNAARRFRGGIVFDMVGDRSLTVTLPPDSPAGMAQGIFEAADALKVRNHFTYATGGILDDHTPLNEIGIPTIDLIDFDYPPWHTPEDTMDKLSAESLRIVGAVALRYLGEAALR
ncbi:MAG: M28 family peptidase [Chthoniobacterales bacterium]|nr:M28 family peptidase [Chthoniobacterales bacterium]